MPLSLNLITLKLNEDVALRKILS